MKRLIDLEHTKAKDHLLKMESYFNGDFPSYINFEPLLRCIDKKMNGQSYRSFLHEKHKPFHFDDVNYGLMANKDGRLAWRPLELIHPVIYVSMLNLICQEANWQDLRSKFSEYRKGVVQCCSHPVVSTSEQSDTAEQISNWWREIEQQSIKYSLSYSALLHTDVSDCYGSLYTHSIPWAVHNQNFAKMNRRVKFLGNDIDKHICDSRFGQTNGISQGSVVMDLIAELVLGYVDLEITNNIENVSDFKILRYRDDYRIFANSDQDAEIILKAISDCLIRIGMKLGVSKTMTYHNVVEGAIKPDKLAGIDLQDLGLEQAKSFQKQILRLHNFARRHPNSGYLKRLCSEFAKKIESVDYTPDDLHVQIAILTDIGYLSPSTFPAIAHMLSHLIAKEKDKDKRQELWKDVEKKIRKLPNNGILEIWLQRVTKPKSVGLEFESNERICQLVQDKTSPLDLWNNKWLSKSFMIKNLTGAKIILSDPEEMPETMGIDEIALFVQNSYHSG